VTYRHIEDGRGSVYGRAGVPVRGGGGGGRAGVPEPGDVPPRRRRPRWGRIFGVLLVLLLVVVVGVAAAGTYYLNKFDGQVKRVDGVFSTSADRPAPGAAGAMNILLIGNDAWKHKPPRSDTIMVVHIPADRSRAYLVSIPRDSWVPVPGNGRAKVNAAYAWGGPALLVRTVEQFTDLRIDHFAQISFSGFKEMTDAVGGVTMPGAGHLNGDQALTYVRERKSLPGGDFDRIKRQQAFIKELLKESTSSMSNPLALVRLLDALSKAISVDSGFSGGELRSLALSMRNIRGSDIVVNTAPTTGTGMVGSQSVVFLDRSAGVELWKAMREDRMAEWTAAHPRK
jgi:anionic cell wall polymer biosynthesis LytR-Cps2A-Psr (LCP) family protein